MLGANVLGLGGGGERRRSGERRSEGGEAAAKTQAPTRPKVLATAPSSDVRPRRCGALDVAAWCVQWSGLWLSRRPRARLQRMYCHLLMYMYTYIVPTEARRATWTLDSDARTGQQPHGAARRVHGPRGWTTSGCLDPRGARGQPSVRIGPTESDATTCCGRAARSVLSPRSRSALPPLRVAAHPLSPPAVSLPARFSIRTAQAIAEIRSDPPRPYPHPRATRHPPAMALHPAVPGYAGPYASSSVSTANASPTASTYHLRLEPELRPADQNAIPESRVLLIMTGAFCETPQLAEITAERVHRRDHLYAAQ